MFALRVGRFLDWLRQGSIFTADLSLAMAVLSLASLYYMTLEIQRFQDQLATLVGTATFRYAVAYDAYVERYFADSLASEVGSGPIVLTVDDLITAGILPEGDLGEVGYGQSVKAVVSQEVNGLIDVLILTVGGQAMPDGQAVTAAYRAGAYGAVVKSTSPGEALRVTGGNAIDLSAINAAGDGTSGGHIAVFFYHDATFLSSLGQDLVSVGLYQNGEQVPVPSCPAGKAPEFFDAQAVTAANNAGDLFSGVVASATKVASNFDVQVAIRTSEGWQSPPAADAQALGLLVCQ